MAGKQITDREYQKRAEDLLRRIRQEVKPFADDSPEAKEKRRKKAEKDLLWFCKTYLGHHFEAEFESGHEKMADSLKNWDKVIAWLGFREIGKSTLAEVGYGIHCILFKTTRFLPVISDTEDQATDLMMPIKIELEENPRIKQDFGDLKGIEWATNEFITSTNVKVQAFGWRGFKRGRKHMQWRFNVCICDDWEDEETAQNASNSKKRYKALVSNVVGAAAKRKGQKYQVLICLNRITRTDLSHILEKNKEVLFVKIPATDSKGRATHPKSFPKSVLNRLKKLDKVHYAKNYDLKIISSEDDDFQEEWFEWLDKPQGPYKYIVMANDPAKGITNKNDTKAWIVLGITADEKHVDVLHAWIKRASIDKMLRMGFKLYDKFKPHKSVIESNGFQSLLKPIVNYMATTEKLGIGFKTSIQLVDNYSNKNVRIMRLQNGIEHQFFRFVRGSDMDRLVNQFLDFKSEKTDNEDDGPDAMEMANRQIKRLMGETGTVEVEIIG